MSFVVKRNVNMLMHPFAVLLLAMNNPVFQILVSIESTFVDLVSIYSSDSCGQFDDANANEHFIFDLTNTSSENALQFFADLDIVSQGAVTLQRMTERMSRV